MLEKAELLKSLNAIDREFVAEIDYEPFGDDVNDLFEAFSTQNFIQGTSAVVGLDIFKYSKFAPNKQALIPFVFDLIFDQAIHYCRGAEPTLFKDYDFRSKFIPTGDGGFIVFPTPLHAFFFILNFYASLHNFNSGHNYPKLSHYLGELIVCCALTFDKIFAYEDNYYGSGIIKNARILSKDKLNRLLIDKNTYEYFMRNFNGIESLPIVPKSTAQKVLKIDGEFSSTFFAANRTAGTQYYTIRNLHVQKVDDLEAKNDNLVVYNVEVQFLTALLDRKDHSKLTDFIFSIGNSNSITATQ